MAANLLGNLLAGKGTMRASEGTIRTDGVTIRAGQEFLMLPHPLINFDIQKYYQNESKLNGIYSKNNLLKIKNCSFVINLNEYESIGAHEIALYVNDNNILFCNNF